MEYTFFIDPPVGVRAKIIPLTLGQVGRQPVAAVGIKISQRSAARQYRDAHADRGLHKETPGFLAALDGFSEGIIQQQVHQARSAGGRRW